MIYSTLLTVIEYIYIRSPFKLSWIWYNIYLCLRIVEMRHEKVLFWFLFYLIAWRFAHFSVRYNDELNVDWEKVSRQWKIVSVSINANASDIDINRWDIDTDIDTNRERMAHFIWWQRYIPCFLIENDVKIDTRNNKIKRHLSNIPTVWWEEIFHKAEKHDKRKDLFHEGFILNEGMWK